MACGTMEGEASAVTHSLASSGILPTAAAVRCLMNSVVFAKRSVGFSAREVWTRRAIVLEISGHSSSRFGNGLFIVALRIS